MFPVFSSIHSHCIVHRLNISFCGDYGICPGEKRRCLGPEFCRDFPASDSSRVAAGWMRQRSRIWLHWMSVFVFVLICGTFCNATLWCNDLMPCCHQSVSIKIKTSIAPKCSNPHLLPFLYNKVGVLFNTLYNNVLYNHLIFPPREKISDFCTLFASKFIKLML